MRTLRGLINAKRCRRAYAEKLKALGIKQRIYRLSDEQHCYTLCFVRFIKEHFKNNLADFIMTIDDDKLVIKFKEKKKK